MAEYDIVSMRLWHAFPVLMIDFMLESIRDGFSNAHGNERDVQRMTGLPIHTSRCVCEVRHALEDLDDNYGAHGPFDKVIKLLACTQKACNSLISWRIFCVVDSFKSGEMPREGNYTHAKFDH